MLHHCAARPAPPPGRLARCGGSGKQVTQSGAGSGGPAARTRQQRVSSAGGNAPSSASRAGRPRSGARCHRGACRGSSLCDSVARPVSTRLPDAPRQAARSVSIDWRRSAREMVSAGERNPRPQSRAVPRLPFGDLEREDVAGAAQLGLRLQRSRAPDCITAGERLAEARDVAERYRRRPRRSPAGGPVVLPRRLHGQPQRGNAADEGPNPACRPSRSHALLDSADGGTGEPRGREAILLHHSLNGDAAMAPRARLHWEDGPRGARLGVRDAYLQPLLTLPIAARSACWRSSG